MVSFMQFRPLPLLRALHAWGGASLALLILLVSLTGTLLVWKQDYLRWHFPEARQPFHPTPQTLAGIAKAVERHFTGDDIVRVEFAHGNFALTKVVLNNGHAYFDSVGNLVGHWRHNERPEDWLYDLHHQLLLGKTGLVIVGIAGLAMLPLTLAGLLVFWPLRRGFRRGLLPRSKNRGQWLSAHRNIGAIAALPLLLVLATGVVLTFPEQAESLLLAPLRGEDYGIEFGQQLDDFSGGNSGDWLPALRRAQASFPDAVIRTAHFPGTFSPHRIIGLQQPGQIAHDTSRVYIHARDGYMDVRIDAGTLPLNERILGASYPVHTGRLDSTAYKLLLTVSGLLFALLSLLGLRAFLKRFTASG